MRRDRRFFAGLIGVATVVTYLVWTGISDAMVYYLTPSELLARVGANPELVDQGVKASGEVVPGSYRQTAGEIFEATEVLTKCGSRYEAMPEGMGEVASRVGAAIG